MIGQNSIFGTITAQDEQDVQDWLAGVRRELKQQVNTFSQLYSFDFEKCEPIKGEISRFKWGKVDREAGEDTKDSGSWTAATDEEGIQTDEFPDNSE